MTVRGRSADVRGEPENLATARRELQVFGADWSEIAAGAVSLAGRAVPKVIGLTILGD
jgi:hypothetical protein